MYQLSRNGDFILRLEDEVSIPMDPGNRDYQEYLASGEGAAPYVAATSVPAAVSAFQARAALAGAGLLDQVEFMMGSSDAPLMARLAWQHATEFHRDSPTVAALSAALGLDEAALDNLFTAAATIVA